MVGKTERQVSYIVQNCEKSFCNKCNAKLSLLCPEQPSAYALNTLNQHWAMFYICFTCRIIYQIGVGKLETEREG